MDYCDVAMKSWQLGLIPRQCPVCKNPVDKLVLHHWGSLEIDFEGKRYRRICSSCNVQLEHIFHGNYPSWDEQFGALTDLIEGYLRLYYSDFDGVEGWWSLITRWEFEGVVLRPALKQLLDNGFTADEIRRQLDSG